MKAEQSKFIAILNSEANRELDITESDQKESISKFDHASEQSTPICSLCRGSDSQSPLCFLILLQVTCFDPSSLMQFIIKLILIGTDNDDKQGRLFNIG